MPSLLSNSYKGITEGVMGSTGVGSGFFMPWKIELTSQSGVAADIASGPKPSGCSNKNVPLIRTLRAGERNGAATQLGAPDGEYDAAGQQKASEHATPTGAAS